jgi:hypothetical protein
MKRKRFTLIFLFAACLFLAGCNSGGNNSANVDSGKTAVPEAQTYLDRTSNKNSNDISDKLTTISKKLKILNIADSWAGYDSKGQIAVCINGMNDRIATHLETYGENYDVFLAKTVFDAIPDVETVYYAADRGFNDFSRDKYIQNGLDKAPLDLKAFEAVKADWSSVYEPYYCLSRTIRKDSKYNPQYTFERLMRNYFSGRLTDPSTKKPLDENWAYGYIKVLAEYGIIAGGNGNDFRIDNESSSDVLSILMKNAVLKLAPKAYNLDFDNRMKGYEKPDPLTGEIACEIILDTLNRTYQKGTAFETAQSLNLIPKAAAGKLTKTGPVTMDVVYCLSVETANLLK